MDGTIEPSRAMSSHIAPEAKGYGMEWGKNRLSTLICGKFRTPNKNDRKLVRSASVTGITAQRARGGLAVDEPNIPFGESRHSAETQGCAMTPCGIRFRLVGIDDPGGINKAATIPS